MEVNHGVCTRFIDIDFPTFSGDDPAGWMYKMNHFFSYHNNPIQRLSVVSIHIESKILIWFQNLEELGMLTNWDAFVKILKLRFEYIC